MGAVVVYESLWGNTEAVARAIGEGLGPGTPVLTTDEADPTLVAAADLLVAGAPIHGFRLGTDAMRAKVAQGEAGSPEGPDLAHPSLRSWLESLPPSRGRMAAFETGLRWSPGGATGTVASLLKRAGYEPIIKSERFIVKGRTGPLKDGEVERARRWGQDLARALAQAAARAA